jgi:hypothetical protein
VHVDRNLAQRELLRYDFNLSLFIHCVVECGVLLARSTTHDI